MGRNTAHGVHRHGAADHFGVLFAAEISPWAIKFNGFVKRYMRHISR